MTTRMFKFITIVLTIHCISIAISQYTIAQGYTIKTIVIDAGHGGKDPGAIGKISKEKDVALKVALLTGKYIEEYLNDVKVVFTRKTDVYIELPERANIAHKANADLFISIHVDAVASKTVTGSSTYVLGLHRTEDNLRVAQKENAVITLEDNYKDKYQGFDPSKPESYIIFNFIQNAYLQQSSDLADLIQDQFRVRVGRHDRGVHQAGFLVLRETSMPSVLVELGFITNAAEEAYLNTPQGQDYMASAIFRAVRDYKNRIEQRNKTIQIPLNTEVKKEPNTQETAPIAEVPAEQPETIAYKLQIITSRKQLAKDDKLFKGLPEVEFYEENGLFKYTVGDSDQPEDIIAIKESLKKRFPDAFIIGFKNGDKLAPLELKNFMP